MYVHMLFYQVGKSLSPVIPAPAVPETPFVAVLGQTELSGAPLPEQMAAHHLPALENIRSCKAEREGNLLWGTLCRPKQGGGRQKTSILFCLWNDSLLLIDDSSLAVSCVEKMRSVVHPSVPGAGVLLRAFLDALIANDLTHLGELEDRAAHMESAVLSGDFSQFDHRMMALRKEISALWHYYAQLSDLALSLLENAEGLFTPEEQSLFKLFSERAARLREETMALREYTMQIREAYQAQIGIRQNEIMKLLTIVTTIFLPLSLIAGWYGMNFACMPELRWPLGYPAVEGNERVRKPFDDVVCFGRYRD
mgnify:CR=1 FL=1